MAVCCFTKFFKCRVLHYFASSETVKEVLHWPKYLEEINGFFFMESIRRIFQQPYVVTKKKHFSAFLIFKRRERNIGRDFSAWTIPQRQFSCDCRARGDRFPFFPCVVFE